MIQRIQSLYLLLVCLMAAVSALLFPVRSLPEFSFWRDDYILIYAWCTVLISAVTLLFFRRRKMQLVLNRIHWLLQFLVLLFVLYGSWPILSWESSTLWVLLPFISLILLYFSRRGIQRDEDLIRSIDRIR
jgi:hypothetical protein